MKFLYIAWIVSRVKIPFIEKPFDFMCISELEDVSINELHVKVS